MHPILGYIGFLPLYSFGVCVACAFLLAWFLLPKRFEHPSRQAILKPLCPDMTYAFMWLGAMAGAKLWYAFYQWHVIVSWASFWQVLGFSGGLVWYGGLLGAILALGGVSAWYTQKKYQSVQEHTKTPFTFFETFLSLLDSFAPLASLGLVFGRIGCWFAGCCYGAMTSLPWGVHYPPSHPTHGSGVHPAPLYEALGALGITLGLYWLERHAQGLGFVEKYLPKGFLCCVFLISYGILRFMVEACRGDTIPVGGLSVSQWVSLLGVVVGMVGLFLMVRSQHVSVKPTCK
jgi:phosphatidylglycerol:prolipoprotein diacylglycerol transferase